MPVESRSWLMKRVEGALRQGFTRAYETVKVDPGKYLLHLQAAHGLPITSFAGVYALPQETLDEIALQTVRASMKIAAVEGAGLGLGGILTVVPDLGILTGITIRMLQKLSLTYGFPYATDEETADLWVAAASAAGVDISRELLEKEVVSRFVPRVIRRIAAEASAEVVEKWAGRIIPIASSVIGATLNYYFIRAWGNRALAHFRGKHLALRQSNSQLPSPAGSPLLQG